MLLNRRVPAVIPCSFAVDLDYIPPLAAVFMCLIWSTPRYEAYSLLSISTVQQCIHLKHSESLAAGLGQITHSHFTQIDLLKVYTQLRQQNFYTRVYIRPNPDSEDVSKSILSVNTPTVLKHFMDVLSYPDCQIVKQTMSAK